MRTNDQHVGPLLFYDTGDLPAPVPEPKNGMALKTLFRQECPVPVQPLLVFSRLIIVALLPQHPGPRTLHDMDQQVSAFLSPLTNGKCQQLLIVLAEIQRDRNMMKSREIPVLQAAR